MLHAPIRMHELGVALGLGDRVADIDDAADASAAARRGGPRWTDVRIPGSHRPERALKLR
jgi:hypothetical protein